MGRGRSEMITDGRKLVWIEILIKMSKYLYYFFELIKAHTFSYIFV